MIKTMIRKAIKNVKATAKRKIDSAKQTDLFHCFSTPDLREDCRRAGMNFHVA